MANDVGNERSELPVRLIIGALVVTGLAVTAASLGFGSIGLAENAWGNVGQVIAVLGVVAVVIERAVEVYVSKRYDARKLRLNRPVARAQNKLTRAQQALREERERREGSTTQQERENDGQMKALQAAVETASESVDQVEDSNWLPVSKMQAEKLRDASGTVGSVWNHRCIKRSASYGAIVQAADKWRSTRVAAWIVPNSRYGAHRAGFGWWCSRSARNVRSTERLQADAIVINEN